MFRIPEIDYLKDPESGAELLVCKKHHLELCHNCTFDYVSMNNEAKQQAKRRKAFKPDGTSLGPGLLLVGTEVRMEDRSERILPSTWMGTITIDDEEDTWDGDFAYVMAIKGKKDETWVYPVEFVHDEYLVKSKGQWVKAKKFLESNGSLRG